MSPTRSAAPAKTSSKARPATSKDAFELIVRDELQLRSSGRAALGTGGELPQSSLRAALASTRSTYLVLVLSGFAALDELFYFVLNALGPEARNALGMSEAQFATVIAGRNLALGGAAIGFSWVLLRRPKARLEKVHIRSRALLAVHAAFVYAASAITVAFTATWWGLAAAIGPAGNGGGAVFALHRPMVAEAVPPHARLRALALHRAGGVLGVVVGALLVVAMSSAGMGWRTILLVTGVISLVVAFAGARIKDPGYGRNDTAQIVGTVAAHLGHEGDVPPRSEGLLFSEAVRRLWTIRTVRLTLACWAMLGVILTPVVTYVFFFLEERWHLGVNGRSLFYGGSWLLAVPALAWFGPKGDKAFAADPQRLVKQGSRAARLLALGLVLSVISPWMGLSLLFFGLVFAASAVMVPILCVLQLAVVQPVLRVTALGLSALFGTVIGGELGSIFLGSIDSRSGAGATIVTSALFAVVLALVFRKLGAAVTHDLDKLVDDVVEETEVGIQTSRGVKLPLLSCRHIDFSYGQVQVLFDVNFSVDEGEMVALLGTNGAGKSTLLSVVSGLGFPSKGQVYFESNDITFIDANRRVAKGLTQIPGGQAVFGPLSVLENLRMYGYSLGANKTQVDRGIEQAFETFPRLGERRSQLASTLSGGEQQMLALGKAMIVKPKLLLIDELSLGLAPKVVQELMHTVRAINAEGTAVVLVEQSVSTALNLVEHAYFMEKGEIRFDGKARELLDRPDLLRSVFLGGAVA